jgi:hypothetical protein
LLASQQHVDKLLAVFETRRDSKLALPHRLQGVPHNNCAREPTPLSPPVATLLQIIDYPGALVLFDGCALGIQFVDPPGLNIVRVFDPARHGYNQYG